MDAAEARADALGQRLAQLRDAQAGGVGRQDGVRGHVRRNLVVQVRLPVNALGNRLDHQVALLEQAHVLFVVGGLDQPGIIGHAQRRGLELLQVLDGLERDAVLRAFLGRQVEQHHRHLHVDEVGGNLRTHHAGAQHGDFLHLESGHGSLSDPPGGLSAHAAAPAPAVGCRLVRRAAYFTRTQVCVRPMPSTEPRTSSLLPPSFGVRRSV